MFGTIDSLEIGLVVVMELGGGKGDGEEVLRCFFRFCFFWEGAEVEGAGVEVEEEKLGLELAEEKTWEASRDMEFRDWVRWEGDGIGGVCWGWMRVDVWIVVMVVRGLSLEG